MIVTIQPVGQYLALLVANRGVMDLAGFDLKAYF